MESCGRIWEVDGASLFLMINGLDDGGSDLLVGEFGCLPVGYVFVIPEGYICLSTGIV